MPALAHPLAKIGAYGALIAVLTPLTMSGCKPEFSERASSIRNYRILAIRTEPAEYVKIVDPDTGTAKEAKYEALVVNPLGTVTDAPLRWAFCTLPKPLTELNDVSIACFQETAPHVTPIGEGPRVSAAAPENACRQFGPDIPEDQAYRPADPDVTSGYYQPVRVLYSPEGDGIVPALGKMRIKCGLPGASQEQTTAYNQRYHLNANPTIASLAASSPRGLETLVAREDRADAPALRVTPGASVPLVVSWPECPLTDACGDGYCGPTESRDGQGACAADCVPEKSCGGAERYLAFDLETRTLRERRETMRASWFVASGGGELRDDRTGTAESEARASTENVYTAPTQPGDYPLWVVLRDSRGGVTWKTYSIHVE